MFFDRAGLPAATYDALRSHLPGGRPRVLAWGEHADGAVVGLPQLLAIQTGTSWRTIAWDEIVTGGWDRERSALRWSTGATTESLVLTSPRRIPELFQERVQASIVMTRFVEIDGTDGVNVSARRNPGVPSAVLRWQATPSGNTTMADPAVQAEVERVLAELRAEWGA